MKYSEFLAATIEAHGAIDEERLAEAFDRIVRKRLLQLLSCKRY